MKKIPCKAYFFLNPTPATDSGKIRNKYGLKCTKCPPTIAHLERFEDDMFKMVKDLKFRANCDDFQSKLKADIRKINSSDKVFFVPADKTRNLYKFSSDEYGKLLRENITKAYRKADDNAMNLINNELIVIANNMNLRNRIEVVAEKEAFITLKHFQLIQHVDLSIV